MKNRKTVLIIVCTILVVSIILYFLPLGKILGNLPFLNVFYNNTSMEIIVEKESDVFINEKEYGQTPVYGGESQRGKICRRIKKNYYRERLL
jgi:hypothetical protein